VLLEVGIGMNDAGDIAACERIGLGDHEKNSGTSSSEVAILSHGGSNRKSKLSKKLRSGCRPATPSPAHQFFIFVKADTSSKPPPISHIAL
jgi:hypothetical protein